MRNNRLFRSLFICVLSASLILGNAAAAFASGGKDSKAVDPNMELLYDYEEEEEELPDGEDPKDEDIEGEAVDLKDLLDEDDADDYIDEYGSELTFDQGIYGYDHRIETYLFIGTDNSGNEAGEYGVDYQGGMADFLTLLVIDHTNDTFGFLEIDRNTIVEMPLIDPNGGDELGIEDLQICFSHYFGTDPENSCDNTVDIVCSLLGDLETIDGYYALNMENIGALADEVGGVEVTLEDDLSYIDPSFVPGATVLLKGKQAEDYCRARMEVGEGDNASRMRRQRAYMKAFYEKAMEKLKQNSKFVTDMYKVMKELAVTNISGNDVSRIAEAMRAYNNKGILGIEGEHVIEVSPADNEEHEAFYPEESSIVDAMKELFSLKEIVSFEDDENTDSVLVESKKD